MKVIRSPSLREGDEVCVVRLYEPQALARGGLAQRRKAREVSLHLSQSELKRLSAKWGRPHRNPKTRMDEYLFPRDALKNMERFADGGVVGYAPPPQMSTPLTAAPDALRTRTADPIDYYTYGMGPEHQFYTGNAAPPAQEMVHLPTTPAGPSTQSAGSSGGNNTLKSIGALAGAGASIAEMFGHGDNPYVQGAGVVGNLASGNYLGALKSGLDLYRNLTSPSMSDYASGSALDKALTEKGFTGEASGAAVGTPQSAGLGSKLGGYLDTAGDLYGIYQGIKEGGAKGYASAAKDAASLAGYDIDSIPIVGAYNIANQIKQGDVGGAGVTAATTAYPLAGLGFAAANLINKSLTGHGDEKRNLAAFLQANPLGITGEVMGPKGPAGGLSGWLTPEGKLLHRDYVDALAGAWYGANAAPDGNQADWQKKYDELLANQRYVTPARGYEWKDGRWYLSGRPVDTYINEKKVAHGGTIHGGGLAQYAQGQHVRGPGTGRSDSIPAQLSDGEYVLTAEDVSLLGDGSNEAGARRLDEFRRQLRKHKGARLARGKISPNAKAPMQYMRGTR